MTHRQELLRLEVEQLETKAELLRLALLPLEIRQLSLLRAKERLEHPPVMLPPAPRPVQELIPRLPGQAFPLADLVEEPLPSAEEQLTSLLGGPSTPRTSSPSSAS